MGWSGPMTHRQYMGWKVYLRSELNRKDKQTYYLMQIAAEVRRNWVDKKGEVDIDHFFLPLTSEAPEPGGTGKKVEPSEEDKKRFNLEEMTGQLVKGGWIACVGGKVDRKRG